MRKTAPNITFHNKILRFWCIHLNKCLLIRVLNNRAYNKKKTIQFFSIVNLYDLVRASKQLQ